MAAMKSEGGVTQGGKVGKGCGVENGEGSIEELTRKNRARSRIIGVFYLCQFMVVL